MDEMIRKLIEERGRIWHDAKALLDREETEGRSLDAEESEQYERMNGRLAELDARIDELHRLNVANKKADEYRSQYESIVPAETWQAQEDAQTRAIKELFAGQRDHVEIDFRSLARGGSLVEPADFDRRWSIRALQKATTSEGGDTVPTSFVRSLYEHIVENSAIRQTNVNVVTTASGENLDFPKLQSHGTAAQVGEAGTIAGTDPSFAKVTLGAFKYGQLTLVSSELLTDTGIDLLGFLARDLGRSIGEDSGEDFIVGDGSSKPNGIVTATKASVGTSVQSTSTSGPTADNLIDLQYAVKSGYANRGYWMMQRATEGVVRKLKGSDNNYLWQPGLQVGSPNLLLGRPIVNDPYMAAVGSAAMSVIFGDFSGYTIRDVGSVRLERSDDYAFNTDQVAWRAILRTDGDLIDTTGCVKGLDTDG